MQPNASCCRGFPREERRVVGTVLEILEVNGRTLRRRQAQYSWPQPSSGVYLARSMKIDALSSSYDPYKGLEASEAHAAADIERNYSSSMAIQSDVVSEGSNQ